MYILMTAWMNTHFSTIPCIHIAQCTAIGSPPTPNFYAASTVSDTGLEKEIWQSTVQNIKAPRIDEITRAGYIEMEKRRKPRSKLQGVLPFSDCLEEDKPAKEAEKE